MHEYGILVYGVWEDNLSFKDSKELGRTGIADLDDYLAEAFYSSKSPVSLGREYVEDAGYLCGFYAGYPWEDRMKGVTQEAIVDALYNIYLPVLDMDKKAFASKVEKISTYNYC